jgi:hypothetical protein
VGKPFDVAANGLIEDLDLDTIEVRHVAVEHHPLAAQEQELGINPPATTGPPSPIGS